MNLKQFIENGNFWRSVYTIVLIFIALVTIAGWKISADASDKYATKAEVNCMKIEINEQLKEIRSDIKLLLRR